MYPMHRKWVKTSIKVINDCFVNFVYFSTGNETKLAITRKETISLFNSNELNSVLKS